MPVPPGDRATTTSSGPRRPTRAVTFVEATQDPSAYQTTGAKGANCESTTFTGVPASTLGDWQNANGTDSPTGWVICTLTYGLVFDDYKGPYSLQGAGDAAEEQKARSVKDYWEAIVSDGGQEAIFAQDYAQLPANILNIARAGVNAVCWDKPGTGQLPDAVLRLRTAPGGKPAAGQPRARVQPVHVAEPACTDRPTYRWYNPTGRATRPCSRRAS